MTDLSGNQIVWADTDVEVHNIVVGPYDNNVYTVRCLATGEALLIDAANEHEKLLEICRTLGVRQVVETHGHWDHIQAVTQIRDAGYQVAVTAADAGRLPSYDLLLDDEQVLSVGNLRIHTILTPGHTDGSICFRIESKPLLFTGDTLFPGGPGNTKGDGGDFETIITSLDTRLFTLDAHHIVLPGHGATTTIGTERPSLQDWVDRGW